MLGRLHSSANSCGQEEIIGESLLERLEREEKHAAGRATKRLKKEITFYTVALETVVDLHTMHLKDIVQTVICTDKMDYTSWSQYANSPRHIPASS
jgi:hypothetical protein